MNRFPVSRAASARKWLPERELFLVVDEEFDDDEDIVGNQLRVVRYIPSRDGRPAWQRFLEAIRPEPAHSRAPHNVPEEIAYVAVGIQRSQSLTLELLGRARQQLRANRPRP